MNGREPPGSVSLGVLLLGIRQGQVRFEGTELTFARATQCRELNRI
jgi:hypothetical protein